VDEAAESVKLVSETHPNPTARAMACFLLCEHDIVTFDSLKDRVKNIIEGYGVGTILEKPEEDEDLEFCTYLWEQLYHRDRKELHSKSRDGSSDLDVDNEFVRLGFL